MLTVSDLVIVGGFYLSNIDLPSVHELQDGGEMGEGNIFQDDDGMLGRVLLQQILEIWAARKNRCRMGQLY